MRSHNETIENAPVWDSLGEMEDPHTATNATILSVFVVNFDTRRGNVLEWCLPTDTDLAGVEFRAMISGAHSVESDYVYFRHKETYGVAVCASRETSDKEERHFRLKSVGVLCSSALHLHRFRDFLENQARSQLCHPGNYDALTAFFEDSQNNKLTRKMSLLDKYGTPAAPMHEPPNCFDNFVHYFGPDIMILWKLMLLRLRVLFYSPPPIGHVCHKVQCCYLMQDDGDLLRHRGDQSHGLDMTEPLFYINVADIPELERIAANFHTCESRKGFVACTTEKIFAMKTHLYDVFVDVTQFSATSRDLQSVLKVNDQDRLRFEQLASASGSQQFCDNADEDNSGRIFVGFFKRLNQRIFHYLGDISSPHSDDHIIRDENFQLLSLHPRDDKAFMTLLLKHRQIDAIMATDACC